MLSLGLTWKLDRASAAGQVVLCRLEHKGYKINRHKRVCCFAISCDADKEIS